MRQIQAFGFNFPSRGWAKCDGTLLAISRNTALYSILGTLYGGDGRTRFGLPDLRGRIALHQGKGPGLSRITMRARGGTESISIQAANVPPHSQCGCYYCIAL